MQPKASLSQPGGELKRREEKGERPGKPVGQHQPFHRLDVLPDRCARVQKRDIINIEDEERHQAKGCEEEMLGSNCHTELLTIVVITSPGAAIRLFGPTP